MISPGNCKRLIDAASSRAYNHWTNSTLFYGRQANVSELTQREIARMSQVSQATVSRVLNKDPRVDAAVAARVLAIVQTHDYAPNSRAQSLRNSRSRTLGLVVHRAPEQLSQDPFFSALIVAVLNVSNRHDYHLCVHTADTVRSQRAIHEDLLRTRRVDGLLLLEPQAGDERIQRLIDTDAPFVLIGRYQPDNAVYSVDNDNVEAARMVMERLLARGCERVAYIGGPQGVMVSEDRLAGCRNALADVGRRMAPAHVQYGDFSEMGGCEAMQRLLLTAPRPDAIIAVDDITAVGAMRAARQSGVRIPDDIAFVGFNNSTFCAYVDPPLSSVSIDLNALAQTATEMLIDLVEGRDVSARRHIIPSRFVSRGTTRACSLHP